MPIPRVLVEYALPDLYEPQRWMCSKCGLILDYQFGPGEAGWPEFHPPLHEADYFEDEHGVVIWEEPERKEICPRCNVDLDETPLIPVSVKEFEVKPYTKFTFIVEDEAHKRIIVNIAEKLEKEVNVEIAGNSEKVKTYFDIYKRKNILQNAYFLVDGDNKPRVDDPVEENFIHLEKYCIENYLIDFQLCGLVADKTVDEIKLLLLKFIQKEFVDNGKVFVLIAQMLTLDHITEEFLAQFDASNLLKRLCRHLSLSEDSYVKKYVEKSFETERTEVVLPSKILNVIKAA